MHACLQPRYIRVSTGVSRLGHACQKLMLMSPFKFGWYRPLKTPYTLVLTIDYYPNAQVRLTGPTCANFALEEVVVDSIDTLSVHIRGRICLVLCAYLLLQSYARSIAAYRERPASAATAQPPQLLALGSKAARSSFLLYR